MASIGSPNNNTNAASYNNVHTNFNPSWMQQTIPTKPVITNNQQKLPADSEETKACDPIFAKHSYGREDLLAMLEKLNTKVAPTGLEKCPFFVEAPHTPKVLLPFTEIEMCLQQNINSSKAMRSFTRTQGHSAEGGTGNDATGGGWIPTAGVNRAGMGANSTGPQRKYQQTQENKQPIPNRWSALATAGNTGAPPKQAWKGGQNIIGIGSSDRTNLREKAGSISQVERAESTSKKQQQKGTHPQENEPKAENKQNDESKPKVGVGSEKESVQYERPKPTTTPPIQSVPMATVEQPQISQPEPIEPQPVLRKWNYLDPTGVQRGPFDSQQMQAWFTNGYFTPSLQLRQDGDPGYITLGELFHINGEQTPFIAKSPSNKNNNTQSSAKPQMNIANNNPQKPPLEGMQKRISPTDLLNAASKPGNNLGLVDVERIWATTPLEDIGVGASINSVNANTLAFGSGNNNTAITPQGSAATTGFAHSAFSQHLQEVELEKILQTREVHILEEQRKLREKEVLLRRDEGERLEKERRMQEMEAELKRKQDELDRIAREKNTEFEKRCMQMAEYERKKREELAALEQRIISDQQRKQMLMEEEDRRRAKELHEMLLREQERQRQLIEAEAKRKREEEEVRLRLAMQEAQHVKELALEQARRAEEEQRRRLIEEQQRQQQRALEEARAERKRQQEVAAKAEAAAKIEQQRITSNLPPRYQATAIPPMPSNSQPQPIPSHYPTQQTTITIPVQPQRSPWQTVPPEASKPIQMNIPSPPLVDMVKQQQMVAAAERERRGWQQVPLPKPAPIPPAITKTTGTSASLTGKQQAAKREQKNTKQKGGSKAKEQPNIDDKLTVWICKRVKELNSSVDAEVFANFIAQIDSPNEAEDYIIGYLGDKKEVKDFHRDFLNKRIELRPRVQPTKKDDLSRPAAALSADAELVKGGSSSSIGSAPAKPGGIASGANGSNTNAGGGAASKKKKQKKVLDLSSLGFTTVSNPNRINAGEIDNVPPVLPGTNRKR